jgi:predicted hydrocarbon binding protein
MDNNSDMIGAYRGSVKNRVITALLQSYLDTLDYDGMKSILREAELLDLKDLRDVDPDGTIDFFSFKKIITAQNCLLYDSSQLLYEIGRKFSFYLYPFGKKFEEVIVEINSLIETNWKVEISEKSESKYVINVRKCVFCSEIGISCDLFKAFLINSLEKSLPSDKVVRPLSIKENINSPDHNSFKLTLLIENKILE